MSKEKDLHIVWRLSCVNKELEIGYLPFSKIPINSNLARAIFSEDAILYIQDGGVLGIYKDAKLASEHAKLENIWRKRDTVWITPETIFKTYDYTSRHKRSPYKHKGPASTKEKPTGGCSCPSCKKHLKQLETKKLEERVESLEDWREVVTRNDPTEELSDKDKEGPIEAGQTLGLTIEEIIQRYTPRSSSMFNSIKGCVYHIIEQLGENEEELVKQSKFLKKAVELLSEAVPLDGEWEIQVETFLKDYDKKYKYIEKKLKREVEDG